MAWACCEISVLAWCDSGVKASNSVPISRSFPSGPIRVKSTATPREWAEPYLARRRQLGKELYAQLGIAKGDQAAMKAQFGRNYVFFDAPVGLFITIEHSMEQGGWIDLGAFLQTFCLAARGYGLDTCPQQAFSKYHRLIRAELDIPESQIVAFGIALGHADAEAAVNHLVVERDPVESFAAFRWE